jgi:hypothetical protein
VNEFRDYFRRIYGLPSVQTAEEFLTKNWDDIIEMSGLNETIREMAAESVTKDTDESLKD